MESYQPMLPTKNSNFEDEILYTEIRAKSNNAVIINNTDKKKNYTFND